MDEDRHLELKNLANNLADLFIDDISEFLAEEAFEDEGEAAFVLMNATLDLMTNVLKNVFMEDVRPVVAKELYDLCLMNLSGKTRESTVN